MKAPALTAIVAAVWIIAAPVLAQHSAATHASPAASKTAGMIEGPPPAPSDHFADHMFDPAEMARARAQLRLEHGGMTYSQIMANLAEYQSGRGGDGYHWSGEAWIGGDINRLVVKSQGEGAFQGGVEAAEVQALASRAISPMFNLQAGLRQDFGNAPDRTYAVLGVEGVAPYWFEVEAAVFLSTKGEVLARAESSYDLRLNQRLILQPRAEIDVAGQTTHATHTGSGLSKVELGLRLRYEFKREFAPYVGVTYERLYGGTADFARLDGHEVSGARFVFGVRGWF